MNPYFDFNFMAFGLAFFVLFVAWSLVWKGWALWVAAKKDSKFWFVLLLVLNTVGIVEILYIFYFSKKGTFKKMDHYADKTVANLKKTFAENLHHGSSASAPESDSDKKAE